VNAGKQEQKAQFVVNGAAPGGQATLTVMKSDDLNVVNSLTEPLTISPQKSKIEVDKNLVKLNMKPYSFNVIRVSITK